MKQESLFENQIQDPLASRMRPTTLQEYVGQKHLISKGKLLWQLIKNDTIPSMIFGVLQVLEKQHWLELLLIVHTVNLLISVL